MGTRTRSEWVENGYRMDIKQLQKGNRSQKGKKHSLECKLYEKAFFRTHACKIHYQSAYQGFKNDTISNTNSSNFFWLSNLGKMMERIILCHFLFLFKQAIQKFGESQHNLLH